MSDLKDTEDFQERFQRLAVPCEKCGGRPLPMLMFGEGKIRAYNVKCRGCHSEMGFVMIKPDEPGIDIDDLARLWNEHNQLDSNLVQ